MRRLPAHSPATPPRPPPPPPAAAAAAAQGRTHNGPRARGVAVHDVQRGEALHARGVGHPVPLVLVHVCGHRHLPCGLAAGVGQGGHIVPGGHRVAGGRGVESVVQPLRPPQPTPGTPGTRAPAAAGARSPRTSTPPTPRPRAASARPDPRPPSAGCMQAWEGRNHAAAGVRGRGQHARGTIPPRRPTAPARPLPPTHSCAAQPLSSAASASARRCCLLSIRAIARGTKRPCAGWGLGWAWRVCRRAMAGAGARVSAGIQQPRLRADLAASERRVPVLVPPPPPPFTSLRGAVSCRPRCGGRQEGGSSSSRSGGGGERGGGGGGYQRRCGEAGTRAWALGGGRRGLMAIRQELPVPAERARERGGGVCGAQAARMGGGEQCEGGGGGGE